MQNPTGKQRSQRIQIDYYQRRTGLDRWRSRCVWIALLTAGAYSIYLLWFLPRSNDIESTTATVNNANRLGNHFSTGPLSESHASFEQNCEKCHQDFTPLDANAPSKWFPLIGVDAEVSRKRLEDACQQCHVAGPHHRDQMTTQFAAIDQDCSRCHRAHQGRDFDLTRVSRKQCAICHDDLQPVTSNSPVVRNSVTAFNQADHGDFASLQTGDSGRIRFSHGQHMLPGQVASDVKGGMTLERLSPTDRGRYRTANQKPSDLVQLRCQSCHESVGQDVISAIGENLKSVDLELLGRSMTPVNYEKHCAACHAISPGLIASGGASSDGSDSLNQSLRLPHAVTFESLRVQLASTIDGVRATGQARHRRDNSKQRRPPGIGEPRTPTVQWRVTDGELAAAEQLVRDQCLECHDPASITDDAIIAAKSVQSASMIPSRWLRRGLFDHSAHRLMDCRYCHADAFPATGGIEQSDVPSDSHDDVMIAGIESCQDCHRPPGTPTPASLQTVLSNEPGLIGNMPTWASDECTTCHRYHEPTMTKVRQSTEAATLTTVFESLGSP